MTNRIIAPRICRPRTLTMTFPRIRRMALAATLGIAALTGCNDVPNTNSNTNANTNTNTNTNSNSTITQRLFIFLGYNDRNNNEKIEKKAYFWSADEGYRPSPEFDPADLNRDRQIDGKEAWVQLYTDYYRNPTDFVVREIKCGEGSSVKTGLERLFVLAPNLSARARDNILKSLTFAGLNLRDIELFKMAFVLSGRRSGTLAETDKFLSNLFHDINDGTIRAPDAHWSAITTFAKEEVFPFLNKSFVSRPQGQSNRLLVFSWLRLLSSMVMEERLSHYHYNIFEFPKDKQEIYKIPLNFSPEYLIKKVIRNSSCTFEMRKYAVETIDKMGEKAVKQLIGEFRRTAQAKGSPGEIDNINILTLLPVGRNTPAGIELARRLKPSIAALHAGKATGDDYKYFEAACQNLSGSTMEDRLAAIGLKPGDIDNVILGTLDYWEDRNIYEAAMARKYSLYNYRFAPAPYNYRSEDFFGSPVEVLLYPQTAGSDNSDPTGLFMVYEHKYSAGSGGIARVSFSFGGNTEKMYFRSSGTQFMYLPGQANILRVGVFGKGASVAFKQILLVYPKVVGQEGIPGLTIPNKSPSSSAGISNPTHADTETPPSSSYDNHDDLLRRSANDPYRMPEWAGR